jgi:hypothetical protein
MSIENTAQSKLILIRSQDRIDKETSTTDFRVDLGSGADIHKVRRVVLRSINFLNAQYNIIRYNDSALFSVNVIDNNTSTTQVIQWNIPSGFYTTTQIADMATTELNLALGAAFPSSSQTLIVKYSLITSRFTVSVVGDGGVAPDSVFTIVVVGGDGANKTYVNGQFGFAVTNSTPATSVTSTQPPRLNGLTEIFIRSTEIAPANLIDSEGDVDNVFLNAHVDVPYGRMMHYEPGDDEMASINYKTPRDLRVVDIQIMDVNEKEIEINGVDVTLVLKVYF